MTVTVNTDASYCHTHKVGSFACWIKCEMGKITKAGPIKDPKNSFDCEIKAIANALYILKNSWFNTGSIHFIYINTDCIAVKGHIGLRKYSVEGKFIAETIRDVINPDYLNIGKEYYSIRHVKAHTGASDPRSYVNEWCDSQAKIILNIQRQKNGNTGKQHIAIRI
jgi:hypothetical protein